VKKKIGAVILTAVIIIGAILYFFKSGRSQEKYETALIDRGDITEKITATGTINPVNSVKVGSQVSGRIIKIYADYRWGINGEDQPSFTLDELKLINEVTRSSGRVMVCHAKSKEAIRRAVLLCKAEKRTMITARDLGEEITAGIRNAIPVQDQVLDLLREKGFSRSSISETAAELGGLNRGTVAEYLRGECVLAFEEQRFDIDAAVRHVSLSADKDINERVRKKLCEYLGNIAEAVDVTQPWENSKAALKPKVKNLPQRYHPHLEQVAEAYYRGLWKLGDTA